MTSYDSKISKIFFTHCTRRSNWPNYATSSRNLWAKARFCAKIWSKSKWVALVDHCWLYLGSLDSYLYSFIVSLRKNTSRNRLKYPIWRTNSLWGPHKTTWTCSKRSWCKFSSWPIRSWEKRRTSKSSWFASKLTWRPNSKSIWQSLTASFLQIIKNSAFE